MRELGLQLFPDVLISHSNEVVLERETIIVKDIYPKNVLTHTRIGLALDS